VHVTKYRRALGGDHVSPSVCDLVSVTKFFVSGWDGLEVACWTLVPKFVGSHPAEDVGFLGRKNPQHAFLRRGSKAPGLMS
jgi:hypothetical protein